MACSPSDPTPPEGGRHTPDRVLIARIAAAERWARTLDRVAATEPARRGLRARFEREADPEGVLHPAERARRADALFTAHMLRLARASARVRAEVRRERG
jgi:hypothetical protein